VTARTGSPHVKKFTEERELTVMLLVDVSASNRFGSTAQLKRDLAAEVAAVLAFSAIANHDRVGLILFSDRVEKHVPPAKGATHVLRVVSEILNAKPSSPKTDLEPALRYLNQVVRRRSVAFLISDFIAPSCEHLLRVTARRHDLVSLVIGDKRESALPAVGLVDFEDAETGRRIVVDTSHAPTRRALLARQTERRQTLLRQLSRARSDAIELNAGERYDRELVRFFRTREKRR
ncbi:MAG TPA: VWA domain-containing protein, partial [Kiritimatiellia bacterium]|nr:VWA domain-containing protein [Kiritimatiellia bacterium]